MGIRWIFQTDLEVPVIRGRSRIVAGGAALSTAAVVFQNATACL
jgi:hypothetical protein